MSHADMPTVVRHCDVAVIGGAAAGLAAALQLGRQRRTVIVIDAGQPRNAPTTHMHGFLGRDGTPPGELIAAGQAEVREYGGEILSGQAVRTTREEDGFVVELAGGHTVIARRIIAATGLIDDLPDIEGLADHWGRTVVHCPFCHGYEIRDRRLVQVVTHPVGLHTTALFHRLTTRLTVLLHGGVDVDTAEVDVLRAAGVEVRPGTVCRIARRADGELAGVELDDGSRIDADAVAVGPRFRPQVQPYEAVGLRPEPHPTGLGDVLATDATGATSVDGVYAAGTITDPSQQVLAAAAHGSRVGATVAVALAEEDVRAGARPSGSARDWDQRYSGAPMWSGNPNGSLVVEATGLRPGRALDVGAGEGGDALWLAGQGWTVTAGDVSGRALDHIRAEAVSRELDVTCLHVDANASAPFPEGGFDLVTAGYAAIPRTPDLRGVHNILDAAAAGGTLIIIGHDREPMCDSRHRHMPFDADAYLRIDDFAGVLGQDPGWTIEVNEKRPRPPGSASVAHHVDDLVLRARRSDGKGRQ